MRFLFFFVFFSVISFANGWDTQCSIPTGKMLILNPNVQSTETNSNASCSHNSGTYYYCYATSEKRETWIVRDPVSTGSSNCNVTVKVENYLYADADCGQDALLNASGVCTCNIPDMVYDTSSKTCDCPPGKSYNGDYCAYSCDPLTSPYILSSFEFSNECTVDNLQSLYNQNNTDGRLITAAVFHCDNKCYFTIGDAIPNSDNNVSDNNGTTDPGIISNTENNNTYVGGDAPLTGDVRGIELKLNSVNSNLGTIGGLIHAQTDVIRSTNEYQGDRLHDDLNSLGNQLDISQGNLESSLAQLDDTNRIGFDSITSAIHALNTDNTSSGGNITISFDGSRIVEANNNTTSVLNDIKNMHEGEVDADTSFLDAYQGYYDDMMQSSQDVENNVNDLMATIQGDYTPQFQHYNSCIIVFPVYNHSVSVNMCRYASILRPFLTFILTVSMLILLIRLHFYLFPKVFNIN